MGNRKLSEKLLKEAATKACECESRVWESIQKQMKENEFPKELDDEIENLIEKK